MTGDGRPLRFLALLLCGWIVTRGVLLWPGADAFVAASTPAQRTERILVATAVIPLGTPEVARVKLRLPSRTHRVAMTIRDSRGSIGRSAAPSASASAKDVLLVGTASSQAMQEAPPPGAPTGRAPLPGFKRWTVSAWFVARDEGNASLAPGGILGGSQAGLRVAYRPLRDAPVALFARASRPLATQGAEAAIGVEAQPFAEIPVRAAIEQRFALERGAAEGTSLSLIGGVSDVRLPAGFLLDGYGQAGVIGWRRRAAFADGAVSLMRPAMSRGRTDMLLGAGIWGAAQPGLSRVDIGPRAELRFPVARQRLRLGVEWRERIAGDARPGSGPALTLGADF